MNSLDGILNQKSAGLRQRQQEWLMSTKHLFTKAKNDATPCTTQGCKLEHPKAPSLKDIQEKYDAVEDRVYAERAKDALVVKNPRIVKGENAKYLYTKMNKWEDKTKKLDYSLIPKEALDREVKRMMLGVEKYSRDDWKNTPIEEHKASMFRHLLAYIHGETDEDHLGAVRAQSGILCALEAQE